MDLLKGCIVLTLTNLKKIFFCITTSSDEIMKIRPNTVLIKSNSRYKARNKNMPIDDSSGVVLLFIATLTSKTYHIISYSIIILLS